MRDMAAAPSSPQVPNTKYTAPSQRTPARDAIPSLLLLVAQARAGATALLPRRLPSVLPSLSLFFFALSIDLFPSGEGGGNVPYAPPPIIIAAAAAAENAKEN